MIWRVLQLAGLWVALTSSNFAYVELFGGATYMQAAERSFFQGSALLVVLFNDWMLRRNDAKPTAPPPERAAGTGGRG